MVKKIQLKIKIVLQRLCCYFLWNTKVDVFEQSLHSFCHIMTVHSAVMLQKGPKSPIKEQSTFRNDASCAVL